MDREIAASIEVLKGELDKLGRMIAHAGSDRAAALAEARDRLRHALAAMEAMGALSSAPQAPAAPSLRDRMVAIAPLSGAAFRTRVKVKGPERPPEPSAAPPRTERTGPPPVDPLTRIRGIDTAMADRLRARGVTSLRDMANWSAADVKRIAVELELGRRISRQNWIEQAALLDLCEPAQPSPPAPVAVVEVPPAETPEPPAAAEPIIVAPPVTIEAAVQADGIETGTTVDREPATIEAEPAEPAEPPPVDATVPVAAVVEHVEARSGSEAPTAAEPLQMAIAEAAPPQMATAVEPEPQPEPQPAPDDLTLIQGIDAAITATLRDDGITRFEQIADWRRADIARIALRLGHPVAISRQGWIEQAALLARGARTFHARRVERGDFLALVPPPPVEALPPVMPPAAAVMATAPASAAVEPEPPQDPPSPTQAPPALAFEATPPDASPVAAQLVPDLATVTIVAKPLPPMVAAAVAPELPTAAVARQSAISHLNIEDEEFPELSVDEAEVMILPRKRSAPATTPAPRATPPSARTLMARLRRASPQDDIDPATYAGYRDHVEEASVEIVRTEPPGKKRPGPASSPPPASPH